ARGAQSGPAEKTRRADVFLEIASKPPARLAKRPQLVQLEQPIPAVAGGGCTRHAERRLFEVAEHPRRPARVRGSRADGELIHRENLNTSVSRFARALAPVAILEPHDVVKLRGGDLHDRRVLERR